MQLTQNKTDVLSNLESQTQQFGISDMSLVMEILTKLYSNPIQTITQEYIANARDAHRELRQTKKIEITAPGRFNAVLSIRDYGPGLSPERINNVFLFYGSSTKRTSNIQNGGFGIGAKSAWAYTDSFTIISRVDGKKRTYIAHRSNGQGNLNLIEETATNEANGTTIEIAVQPHDVERFKDAILRTVYFWPEREQPILKGFTADELKRLDTEVDFDLYKEFKIYKNLPRFITDRMPHKDFVVIDGIPYPNRCELAGMRQLIRSPFVLFLNTGDVNMLPSREEFTKDPKAINFFNNLDTDLTKRLKKYIQDQLASLPSLKDGLKQFIELRHKFQFDGKYKQYCFDHWNVWIEDKTNPNGYYNHLELGDSWEWRGDRLKKGTFNRFGMDSVDQMFFDDMPNESATKKVWRVRKQMKATGKRFRLVKQSLKYLADELGLKNLSEIDATDYKVDRATKAATKKLEICVHYFNHKLEPTQVTLANVTDTIVYDIIDSDTHTKRNYKEVRDNISYINSLADTKFGFIAESFVSKIANNKQFVKYEDFIKAHKPTNDEIKYRLKLDCADRNGANIQLSWFNNLKVIKDAVKDEVIKYFIDLALFNPGTGVSGSLPKSFIPKDNKLAVEHDKMLKAAAKFEAKYPMLEAIFQTTDRFRRAGYKEDVVKYLNDKHESA